MNTAPPTAPLRVLIADADVILSRRLADYLQPRGFEVKICVNGREAKRLLQEFKPRFVLADLMLLEGNALELIDHIKTEPQLRHQFIHVLVMSGHNVAANVKQALSRGAKDYIVKPFRHEDILKRLVFHSRAYRELKDLKTNDYVRIDEATLMLHLTDLVLKQALRAQPLKDILFNLTRMVSLKVDGVRCSIVECLDQKLGRVVTSNDDIKVSGLKLDLYKYPEILHVMNTQTLVAVDNLQASTELKHVTENVREISFNSLIVCPVGRYGQPFGVLSLRMPPEKLTISDNEIRFVEIVSHVVSLVLSNEIYKQSEDFWQSDKEVLHQSSSTVTPLRAIKKS